MAGQRDKQRLLSVLTEIGGSAGNGRLREALGWDEARYGAVKEDLVAEGALTPGRGRGGSVALAGAAPAPLEEPAPVAPSPKPANPKPASPNGNGNGNGGALGIEADLFKTADKLRGNMEPSDYKHVALGLIFLKHIQRGS